MASLLEVALKDINKKYNDNIGFVGLERKKFVRIPFTSPKANYCLYGGIARNTLNEFFGEEGSGKTTTALDIVKNAQEIFKQENKGKKILYVDVENMLDEQWAEKLGVNTEDLILIRPQEQTTEQILDIMETLIKTGEIGLFILDSVATMIPQAVYEESYEKKNYGGNSAPLTRFVNKVVQYLKKYDCTGIFINQVRQDMDNPYNDYITPGGQALKHQCATRIKFRKDGFFDKDFNDVKNSCENPYGHYVRMAVVKTKICNPDRKLGYYSLVYSKGIAWQNDLISSALSLNIIEQKGAWYYIIDDDGQVKNRFQGQNKLFKELSENDEFRNQLLIKVNKALEE